MKNNTIFVYDIKQIIISLCKRRNAPLSDRTEICNLHVNNILSVN